MLTNRLCLIPLLVPLILAADWPRFRGPNGSGVVQDSNVLTSWGLGDVLHKIAVPGHGNSSPVVARGKLFLQSASDDGSERMMLCYDARTLKHLWTANVPGGRGKTHAKNSLASSTPAADGERVIGLFWDGKQISLYAFDLAGNEQWHAHLGGFASQHGAGQSPILHAGKVYLNNDQDGKAEFLCLDAATGKRIWSAERTAFRSCYATPFVRKGVGGAEEIVVASTAGLTAYEPASGRVRWQWEWIFEEKPLRNVGSPIESGGLIFAVAGDGDGSRHMVAIAPPTDAASSARLMWEKKRGTPYVPGPLALGDHIYWVSDTGFADCVEAKTGRVVFDERFTGGITASPLLVNGQVLCVDERGNAFSFAAEPKFSRPRKMTLGEGVIASPAAADGRLYIRGEQHLFVIGKRENGGTKP